MNCRFCEQWNPEGELRCCFCNNGLDSTVDQTLSGKPDYLRNASSGVGLRLSSGDAPQQWTRSDGVTPFQTLVEDLIRDHGKEAVVRAIAIGVAVLLALAAVCAL